MASTLTHHLFEVQASSTDLEQVSVSVADIFASEWILHVAEKCIVNQLRLQREFVGNDSIWFPDDNQQREIVAILDTIDRKIHLHRQKRSILEDLFKALLHMLMTGEIQVEDLNLPSDRGVPIG